MSNFIEFFVNSEIKRRFDTEAAAEQLNSKLKNELEVLKTEFERKQKGKSRPTLFQRSRGTTYRTRIGKWGNGGPDKDKKIPKAETDSYQGKHFKKTRIDSDRDHNFFQNLGLDFTPLHYNDCLN